MRAAAIDRFGGPGELSIHELPVPTLAAGEVLIAVHTSGVGSWDADVSGGWYPAGRPHFPLVLGTDGSGVVVRVGAGVRRFRTGDRVYAYRFANVFGKGGFYAEFVAIPARNVARIPRGLDLTDAGAMTVTGLTALQGIDDALHLKPGETIVIHGASGGVGTLAVQFAKLRRARVLATASGRGGVLLARRLCADVAVDGKHVDLAAALRRFAPDGVDAVLALAGGKPLTRCLDAVRRGGRLAYPTGIEPQPRKRRGLEIIPYDAVVGPREFDRMRRAVEASKLQVPIAASYPLGQAAQAHRRIAAGHVLGKIVLRVKR
jgi:NADPH:quinone reductase-like Zn-dependent oxidoreductase